MSGIDLLILTGSPGSGKSTLADAILDTLNDMNVLNAVIDMDSISLIYPMSMTDRRAFAWKNLETLWPNYTKFGDIKITIPTVIDTEKDLEVVKKVAEARSMTICELTAPLDILKERVTKREPNEQAREKLRKLVDSYTGRGNERSFIDFRVNTADQNVYQTANEIIKYMGWSPEQ